MNRKNLRNRKVLVIYNNMDELEGVMLREKARHKEANTACSHFMSKVKGSHTQKPSRRGISGIGWSKR
jgi:hypothetical protein